MANPHTITYFSREEVLASGDKYRLRIDFTINVDGTDDIKYTYNENIYVNNYGSLEWNYDFENFLLVPGFLDLKLAVPNGSDFEKYFFGETLPFTATEKTPKVTLEIMYKGDAFWTIEFKGYIINDTIDYDPDRGYLLFTVAPRTDILNRQMLYDLNDDPINPLGYSVPTEEVTYYYQPEQIIRDCYGVANPGVQLDFYHDWIFRGFSVATGWLEDIVFPEIRQDIRPLFFDPSKGLITIGDVLRKLAMDWFAVTGMLHQDKAFFKKLFSPSATYELSEETHFDFKKKYKLNLIYYVYYRLPENSVNIFYERGTFTELEGQYIKRDQSLIGFKEGAPGFTNIKALRSGNELNVWKAKDELISLFFEDYGDLITSLWFLYRGDITKCRIDPIITPGIKHSILQNPIFQGRTYQPIRLKKLFMEGKTEIDGLLIAY